MIDILSNQAEIIASLQTEAIALRQREPPASVSDILRQINDAAVPLSGLDSYHEVAQIKEERDQAVEYLNRLITKLLGVSPMPVLDQATLDRVVAAEAKIDLLRQAGDQLTGVQAALEAEKSAHAADVKEALDKLNEVLSHVDGATTGGSASTPPATPPTPPAAGQ